MADIRIVPGSSIMSFTSSLNYIERITQDPSGSLTLYGSGSTGRTDLFSIDGNNGRLFSVSDDLSDSLFSVNTIAGLPVIEAFANNTVVLGQYGQNVLVVTGSNVGIGTAAPGTYSGYTTLTINNASNGGLLDLRNNGTSALRLSADSTTQVSIYGATNVPMAFSTNATERMRIAAAGNVGIGTTSPNQKLSVVGANTTPTLAGNEGTLSVLQGLADYGIVMGTKSSGNGWIQAKRVDGTATAYNLELQPLGGNVGIGTSSPSQKLEVNGTAYASSDFRAPIFYDSADTSYYVNANSTSRLDVLLVNKTIEAVTSVTAPIFYDRDNTAYYVNPASTSILQNLNVNGQIYTTLLADIANTAYYFDGNNTGDSIRVAGDIVAYYSDERLKDRKGNIENALEKLISLNGFYYEPNERAQQLGYKKKTEVGVSAQEVEAILPEIIKDAPIGNGYKTLDYSKLVPLLIEAIKELKKEVDEVKSIK